MTGLSLLLVVDAAADVLLATLCFALAVVLARMLARHADRAFHPLVTSFQYVLVVSGGMYLALAAVLFDPPRYWVGVSAKVTLVALLLVCAFACVRSLPAITSLRSRALLERANAELEVVNARLEEAIADAESARKELAVAAQRLRTQTVTDALTEVANRRGFDARLSEALADCRRSAGKTSLLMIDIDSFKKYNDTFGHPQGDACLRRVAEVISTSVNRPRDFVARFGGEEFTVIMEATDGVGARFLAERIRASIADLALPQGEGARLPFVTASVGVATAAFAAELVPDLLLFRADQALYAAKRAGGNTIVVAQDHLATR